MARTTELHVLRLIPGTSPIHRLWAGTKLVAVVVLSVALSVNPTWPALAVAGGLLVGGILLARIPRGAFPRLPGWFWVALGIGWLLTLSSTAKPIWHVGTIAVSGGGAEDWLRLTLLGAIVLFLAWLMSWTTALADIAPALSRLMAPLRWIRVPVDELAVSVALGTRCLPLLIDEVRILMAARRLRHRPVRTSPRGRIQELHLLLSAAIIVALRRAAELGRAIDARGGIAGVTVPGDESTSPHWRDLLALAVVAAAAVAVVVV